MEFEGAPAAPAIYSVKDVSAAQFIAAYAAYLQKSGKIQLPKNVELLKTGLTKELAPVDLDWYYTRMATVARRVYLCPGVGVGALSKYFGGVDNKTCMRQHHRRGARGVLRHILIQMESNGLVETNHMETAEGSKVTSGRTLTAKGRREMDRVARSVAAME